MYKIIIETKWIEDLQECNVPFLPDLEDGESRSDISFQKEIPPVPNIVKWEITTNNIEKYQNFAGIKIISIEQIE